jgi:hypothetical protein
VCQSKKRKFMFLGNAGFKKLLYVPTTRKTRNGEVRPEKMSLICVNYDEISGHRVLVKRGIFVFWGIRNF